MATSSEPIPGKIFIGGIAPTTTREAVKKHFGKYGDLIDSVLMLDKLTGKSRGFGFVTFRNVEVVQKVLAESHYIDGKKVECKQALPALENQQEDQSAKTTKVFVGGIAQSTTETSLKKYFEQFGKVEECFIMFDRATSKSRGFGFVTFATAISADKVIDNFYDNVLDGKWVECKKAFPKDLNLLNGQNSATVTPQKQKSNGDGNKSTQKHQNQIESSQKTDSLKQLTDTPDRKKSVDQSLLTPENPEEKDSELKVRQFRSFSENTSVNVKPATKSASDFIYESHISYWNDFNTPENSTKSTENNTEQSNKFFGGSEEDQEDNKQIECNALHLLNQMDSAFDQYSPVEKGLMDYYSANTQIYKVNEKPRRISRLFGVDIYDLQDLETCLRTSDLNHYTNGQTKRVFFPAAQKLLNHTSVFDTYHNDNHQSLGSGHLFKHFQSVWARDTKSLDKQEQIHGQDYSIS